MKRKNVIITASAAVLASVVAGLAVTGKKIGWGPFGFLYDWDRETDKVTRRYPFEERQKEIVFYGASNFRLWKEMENDLKEYKVQNHGFGGSTDKLLVKYADKLLYPYNPEIVCFQTGSNDYVTIQGSDDEKVRQCIAYKRGMFELFHAKLPDASFVVMSGLLLPGRAEYSEMTREINRQLKQLCDERDYMYFVDAEDLTFNNDKYRTELFIKDGIHLNHPGQLMWCENYIRPVLEKVIKEKGHGTVRREK